MISNGKWTIISVTPYHAYARSMRPILLNLCASVCVCVCNGMISLNWASSHTNLKQCLWNWYYNHLIKLPLSAWSSLFRTTIDATNWVVISNKKKYMQDGWLWSWTSNLIGEQWANLKCWKVGTIGVHKMVIQWLWKSH